MLLVVRQTLWWIMVRINGAPAYAYATVAVVGGRARVVIACSFLAAVVY